MDNLKVALAVATAALAVAASGAQAGHRYGHGCCGPLPTVHSVTNVNKVSHVTRYHDVYKTRYVDRPKLFEHITVVHPLVYVSNVTRVHHNVVGVTRPVYRSFSEMVAPQYIYSSRTIDLPEVCCCK